MPRLRTSLLLHAHAISPLLPLLLRSCRDLPSALNELRWLREHAVTKTSKSASNPQTSLHHMCAERARGRPLQYILGTQPFGALEILCKPGVLIPRPETEAYTLHLAHLLRRPLSPLPSPLRILDLCTGTACIALLLSSLLSHHPPHLPTRIHGIDSSPRALSLARQNRLRNLPPSASAQVSFSKADILSSDVPGQWHVVVANPPYVSPRGYDRETERGVRNWEPRGALVPGGAGGLDQDAAGDVYYPRLVEIAEGVGAGVLVVEVGGMGQAGRVAGMVVGKGGWDGCEIWRDWVGEGREEEGEGEVVEVDGERVRVRGEGNGRVVVCWRGEGGRWIGRGER